MQIAKVLDLNLKHVLIQERKFVTLDSTRILFREETVKAG